MEIQTKFFSFFKEVDGVREITKRRHSKNAITEAKLQEEAHFFIQIQEVTVKESFQKTTEIILKTGRKFISCIVMDQDIRGRN